MSLSNFGRYIYEREGKQIIEDEHGFATFLPCGEFMYIEDIYVVPEQRKNGVASRYADEIAKHALQKGYKKLLGSVKVSANGSTNSIKVLLAYGFKLYQSHTDV